MSEHTRGPWTLGEWDRNIFVYGGPNNDDIAEFNFADEHTVKITREEAVANARLFLVAPQMLAALVAIDAALCGGFDTQAGRMAGRKALIAVRAAINKAVEGLNECDVLRGAAPSGSEQECDSRSPKSTAPRLSQSKGRMRREAGLTQSERHARFDTTNIIPVRTVKGETL